MKQNPILKLMEQRLLTLTIAVSAASQLALLFLL